MKKQYRASGAGRMGSQFAARLASGILIDRNRTSPDGKMVKTLPAHGVLGKFAQRKETT
jgi:hypothetical protein